MGGREREKERYYFDVWVGEIPHRSCVTSVSISILRVGNHNKMKNENIDLALIV